jgi:N-acetylglucosaminyl-diphospho-decaprenol L-rhamnosyltransferase
MKQPIELSIVIVNWKSREFLENCLESIQANCNDLTYEIIVIDNASYDGCKEMLESQFADVVFIQSDENLGFARANNLAYNKSRGQNILFLNPDTKVQERALQTLMETLETIPDAGMVGAKLLNSDNTLQTTCITALPSILNQALASNYLRNHFPSLSIWGMRPLYSEHQKVSQVEAISGACMLAKREILDSIGCFTTDYFMYAEDMDLCIKVNKMGAKIYYVPEAVVVHYGGGSSSSHSESNFSSVMQRESLAKFFELHRGRGYALMYRTSTVLISAIRMAVIVLSSPITICKDGYRPFSRRANKWSSILRWAVDVSKW